MTPSELKLWNKIELFELDDEKSEFHFSKRLAIENGWKLEYALRVIEEYKKFIFLCCISETGLTPPDPIDQAWHLHLTYTKSYWIDFCQGVLGKDIHHNPTKGGHEEKEKFFDYYESAQLVYFEKFEEHVSKDIWQGSSIRFTQINYQRVNLDAFWLIKKISKQRINSLIWGSASFFVGTIVMFLIGEAFIILSFICFFIGTISIYNFITNQIPTPTEKYTSTGCDSSCGSTSDSSHSGCSGCSDSGCSGCGSGCGGD